MDTNGYFLIWQRVEWIDLVRVLNTPVGNPMLNELELVR
jgi:hypothetical protein